MYCADTWKNLCREYKEKSCRTGQFASCIKGNPRQYPIVNGITEPAFRIPQARIFRIPESRLPYMGRNRTESVENIGFIVELKTLYDHTLKISSTS